MVNNKNLKLCTIFLIVVFSFSFISANYVISNPQYTQFGSSVPSTILRGQQEMCEAGQDFILQIAPFGCTPAVVRSDLLAEQNVPVFCQIAATKLNPMIDVEAINNIDISGQRAKGVSGFGFHPARSALGVQGNEDIGMPLLNNIGYAVIVLEKQKNSSALPDFVEGTLDARIRYDLKNAFGIGKATFYLPDFENEEDWENRKEQYSFWNGRASLKADAITDNSATISVYTDTRRIGSATLEKGKTSNDIYLPGFDCWGALNLRLDGLDVPDTGIRLKVNEDIIEVKKGETFLENRCSVKGMSKQGLVQKIDVSCKEDDGGKNYDLRISPKVTLKIGDTTKDYEVGDKLPIPPNDGKLVYLGFIGTKGDSGKEQDLYVRFVLSPHGGDKLTDDMLSEVARFDDGKLVQGGTVKRIAGRILEGTGEFFERFIKYLWKGTRIRAPLDYGVEEDVYGTKVKLVGVASPINLELTGDKKNYYQKAKQDYEEIINYFSFEKYPEGSVTLGQQALNNLIQAAFKVGEKKTVLELCEKFKENYPSSINDLSSYCNNGVDLSNSKISTANILINGDIKQVSFEKITEPSFDDYGAAVVVNNAGNDYSGLWHVGRQGALYLSETEYIKLKEISEDYALFSVEVTESAAREDFWKTTDLKIKLNEPQVIGLKKYSINVNQINLKKIAKVSVLPKINNVETHANFSFKIGIEDRSIKLSPEKTKEKIANLDESIKDWGDKSEALGNVVKGMKGACLATGAFLTVKNFINNLDGKSIARQNVMRGDNGWYDKCKEFSLTSSSKYKGYKDVDECLVEEASNIEKDVDAYAKALKEHNDYFKKMQEDPTVTSTKTFLGVGDKYVNDDALKEKILNDPSFKSKIESCLNDKFSNGIIYDKNKDAIPVHDFMTNYLPKVSVPELKDLSLGCYVGGSSTLNEMSSANLKSVVTDVYIDEREQVSKQAQIDAMKNNPSLKNVGYSVVKDKDSLEVIYEGGEVNGDYKLIEGDSLVQKVNYKGETFMVKLKKEISNGIRAVDEVYSEDGSSLFTIADTSPKGIIANEVKTKFVFKSFDEKSYQNPYVEGSYEITYYETDPYKGLPATVPFDVKNGWYAYMKQTLPIFGNIASYTESGRVMSMTVCNIGPNKKQENAKGDDICMGVNLGTGQAYNVFPGLDSSKAKEIIDCAVSAVEQASKAHKSGVTKARINTKCGGVVDIKVGKPAVDIPEMQCQDFMSVKDCQILFNVCDPVICPSSRCDFGGAYPVQDVIQSGIIGSIALCLPNFNANPMKGTVIPVCLSGIKAGLDGYLSILTAHRDCLQESLDTGEMVGICDEIYSIYLCDFFWKQGLPLAKIAIPKVLEWVLGQNVHGGGEYLGVKSAWESAGNSVSYFTQYYAANSFKAFKARTAEDVGDEVCKSYASAVYPEGGNLLDSLTDPDSPPQFHGRFDEIPFTTATNPPTSQYKVYYHIYAGKDSRAYYSVYLQGAGGSSYYFDTSSRRAVDSGYISRGGYASETVDFIAPSGYKELCIRVNEQEECGFKEVSTSFAVDYITDQYIKEQASQTDVATEKECVSGSPSLYNLATLNAQGAAESEINPAIYNQGIIRICATDNPGKGSDYNAGMNNSRWAEVGYCGDKKMKCWLDTQSVKDAVEFNTTSTEALETVNENYQKILMEKEGYLTIPQFDSKIKEIEELNSQPEKKITLINVIINKVLYNNQKAKLLLERAKAYIQLIPFESEGKPEEKVDNCPDICKNKNYPIGKSVAKDYCDTYRGVYIEECCCWYQDIYDKIAYGENAISECEDFCGNLQNTIKPTCSESLGSLYLFKQELSSYFGQSCCCYAKTDSISLAKIERHEVDLVKTVQNKYSPCDTYSRLIISASEENGIPDPLFLMSLMIHESSSGGKYCLVNDISDNSFGLMQLMESSVNFYCVNKIPGIASFEDIKGSKNVKNNIYCGAKMLKGKYEENKNGKQFSGACDIDYKKIVYKEWAAALRGYNGWSCDRKYPNQDMFVDNVLKVYSELNGVIPV